MARWNLLLPLLQLFLLSSLMVEVSPQRPPAERPRVVEDLYTSVNYKWLKSTETPSDSFKAVQGRTNRRARNMVASTARKVRRKLAGLSDLELRVGKWYLSGTSILLRAKDGLRPLAEIFDAIRTVEKKAELVGILGRKGFDVFFELQLYPEASGGLSITRLNMAPSSGLLVPGLPYTDYLLQPCINTTDFSVLADCAQLGFLERTFEKLGDPPNVAKENAEGVVKSIVSLLPKVADSGFYRMRFAELVEMIPQFDFPAYFQALGLQPKAIFVHHSWLLNFAQWIGTVSDNEFRAFLRWRVVASLYKYLEEDISRPFYAFASPARLNLTIKHRVFATMNEDPVIGVAVGQLLSRQLLPPKTFHLVYKFVETLRKGFRNRIENLPWMQKSTRAEALKKLDAFQVFIGAPQEDVLKGLVVTQDSYIGNGLRAKAWSRIRDLGFVDMPEARRAVSVWTSPQEVNAFYSHWHNSIYINAALLQPPFFNIEESDEVNFGAVGTIIGHEMTHGFDDQGRIFDSQGMMNNWWTENDDLDFKAISSQLISQFNHFTYFGMPVKGLNTLGENIADLGGLAIAYHAWNLSCLAGGLPLLKKSSRKEVRSWPKKTESHRFFFAYARMWRTVDTINSAYARRDDAHAPPIFRVNGPASNLEAFYTTFNLQEGHRMYREPSQRITIW